MDAEKQLIQVGGLIQCVDDVGNDLALFLHSLQIGDVEKADDDGFDAGVAQMILGRNLKPAPQSVLALEAATGVKPSARRFRQLLKTFASGRLLFRMEQVNDGLSDQIAGKIAEDTAKPFICIENRAFTIEERKQFACRSQQRGELLGTQNGLLGR